MIGMFFGPLSDCTWRAWHSAGYSQFGRSFVLNIETFAPSLPRNSDSPGYFDSPFIATSPFIRQIRVSSHFTVCSHAVEKQRTTFNVVLSIQAIGVHLPRKTNWVLGARMLGKLINCRRLLNPNWSCRARWLFDNMLYFTVCRLRLVIKLASSI